jgi:hypothetical protein
MEKALSWVPFLMGRGDYLPSVGEPERGLVTQAAKGTAAEGGGLFLRLSPLLVSKLTHVSTRKKGTRLGAFLACSP